MSFHVLLQRIACFHSLFSNLFSNKRECGLVSCIDSQNGRRTALSKKEYT